MSGPPERKPSIRGRPALVAAAARPSSSASGAAASAGASSSQPSASTSTPNPPLPARMLSASQPMRSSVPSRAGSSVSNSSSMPDQPSQPIQRMKFKPKVPARRIAQPDADIKPDVSTPPPMRGGGPRGRGRGGSSRARGAAPVAYQSLPAGPFGGPRPASTSTRKIISASSSRHTPSADTELYSDNEDDSIPIQQQSVIDIDQVSQMHESAPTSLYRDRKINEKGAKGKVKDEKKKLKIRTGKDKGKDKEIVRGADETAATDPAVKAEPVSPVKPSIPLDPNEGVPPPTGWRDDDAMMSGDEEQDRDEAGRRVRAFAQSGGVAESDDEDVNEAQMVDLSESEEEEEEDDLTGDFIQLGDEEGPENKLFMFQFPNLFPRFEDTRPVDVTATAPGGDESNNVKPQLNVNGSPEKPTATLPTGKDPKDAKPDVKPDIKPNAAQLRGAAKKYGIKPPEGRIGSLVVMRSGRVKMVLGDGIVMNVSPGVETTFLQQLVHLDKPSKAAVVLGEVNKNYVVTPDIDRLLQDLFVSGGQTPGDREWEARKAEAARIRREGGQGLMKMEIDD